MNEVNEQRRALAMQAQQGLGNMGVVGGVYGVPTMTLRENIDQQIKSAEERVADLIATKARLESSGILDTRISDLQAAMRW